MKKIFLLFAASAFVISCSRLAENEFEIKGSIDPSLNGKFVYLEQQGGYMGFVPMDTAKIENGKFIFKGTVTDPSLNFIQVDGLQGKAELILENGEIKLEIDKDSIYKSKRSGTYNNDKLSEYYNDITKVRIEMITFQQKHQNEIMDAYQKGDTVSMNRINEKYNSYTTEMESRTKKFIENNPKAFVSVLLVKQFATMQKEPMAEVEKMYNSLSTDLRKTKEGKEIAEILDNLKKEEENKAKVSIGNTAPDFSAPNPDGKTISLKESLGKVTIIDFWASWCKPCRIENPNVVAMYNELHSKGLNIIGVSLDENGDKWKEAIAADKLTWNQISNLQGWKEPIAQQYGVKSIPAVFILDAEGKIVATDLRGDALKQKVKELLKVE